MNGSRMSRREIEIDKCQAQHQRHNFLQPASDSQLHSVSASTGYLIIVAVCSGTEGITQDGISRRRSLRIFTEA